MTLESQQLQEAQEIIREKVAKSDCKTGYVTFPDNDTNRIQVLLSGNELTVDLLNSINETNGLHYHVVFVKPFGDDSLIVELER